VDIAVDEVVLVMDIAQSRGYMLEIRDNRLKSQASAGRMPLAQCFIGGRVHHDKGETAFHGSIEDTQDVGVVEARQELHLSQKLFVILIR
jgi:hypothetical protein